MDATCRSLGLVLTALKYSRQDAFFAPVEQITLAEATGRTCAELVSPDPPEYGCLPRAKRCLPNTSRASTSLSRLADYTPASQTA